MYSTLVYSSVVYSIAAHRTEEGLNNIVYTCDTMVTKKTQSLPINFYDVLNAENGGRAKKNYHGGLDDIYDVSMRTIAVRCAGNRANSNANIPLRFRGLLNKASLNRNEKTKTPPVGQMQKRNRSEGQDVDGIVTNFQPSCKRGVRLTNGWKDSAAC